MHISKTQFYLITALFLMLPFSVNYRLLLFGSQTIGTVKGHRTEVSENIGLSTAAIQSTITFRANTKDISFSTPENINYPIGKEVKIFYRKKKPEKFIMFTFSGLVFNNKMIVPGVLFIMWFAFYFTVRETFKFKSKKGFNSDH